MTDDPDTADKNRHVPGVITGKAVFEKARENASTLTRAREHAALVQQMNIRKRLVTRILNRERNKPILRVVK